MRSFAIAGAPKAATTALANALSHHPEIAFSIPKEPCWFGSDLEPLRRREGIRTHADYLACFEPASRKHTRWRGEASTLYLSSPDAIAQLNEEEPDSLVICVVRNPIDVAQAFHMQMVYSGFEPLADFGDAWRAREWRADSPSSCPIPRLLQYECVAALGRQVERVIDRVGPGRTHIVVYDDVVDDPRSVMAGLAAQLELSKPLQTPGPKNHAMALRSPRLARALRSTPGRRAARMAKAKLPPRLTGPLLASKDQLLKRARTRNLLPAPLREELIEAFTPEVRHLEAILDRDLGHWLDGGPSRRPG